MLKISTKSEIKKQVYGDDISFGSEQHHAMHALTFFLFMTRRVLKGEPVKKRLLGRILHHLMDLREYLEEGECNHLVNVLISKVRSLYDKPALQGRAALWLVQNRRHVIRFAACYKREEIFKNLEGLNHA